MILTILACATDEFQTLEKCDSLEKMCKQSTLIKISSVWCFLRLARPVYYHLHLNLIKNKLKTILFFKEVDFCYLTPKNCGLKDKLLPNKMHISK